MHIYDRHNWPTQCHAKLQGLLLFKGAKVCPDGLFPDTLSYHISFGTSTFYYFATRKKSNVLFSEERQVRTETRMFKSNCFQGDHLTASRIHEGFLETGIVLCPSQMLWEGVERGWQKHNPLDTINLC